ncbi:MAG: ABC transporter permease subunit [Ignavibacteria bacterium]|nr:ABC transporter permease subunit [Ignavibacteria bacterium]
MFARDYPLILGATIVAGLIVMLGNLLADMFVALIDPRIRLRS